MFKRMWLFAAAVILLPLTTPLSNATPATPEDFFYTTANPLTANLNQERVAQIDYTTIGKGLGLNEFVFSGAYTFQEAPRFTAGLNVDYFSAGAGLKWNESLVTLGCAYSLTRVDRVISQLSAQLPTLQQNNSDDPLGGIIDESAQSDDPLSDIFGEETAIAVTNAAASDAGELDDLFDNASSPIPVVASPQQLNKHLVSLSLGLGGGSSSETKYTGYEIAINYLWYRDGMFALGLNLERLIAARVWNATEKITPDVSISFAWLSLPATDFGIELHAPDLSCDLVAAQSFGKALKLVADVNLIEDAVQYSVGAYVSLGKPYFSVTTRLQSEFVMTTTVSAGVKL